MMIRRMSPTKSVPRTTEVIVRSRESVISLFCSFLNGLMAMTESAICSPSRKKKKNVNKRNDICRKI